MDEPIRLLIADDHPPTRAGVRAALEGHGFEVCAEARNAKGAVEAALRERPEVCLLDIHMPGNGIAAAARISEALPDTAIVMLTVVVRGLMFPLSMKQAVNAVLVLDVKTKSAWHHSPPQTLKVQTSPGQSVVMIRWSPSPAAKAS